ncbi:hypothetical protein BC829DRAFT_406376, partial [Chytridium lagenaria]
MNVQEAYTMKTTKVSALQRKGRAGRLGPGKCYRLYSADEAAALVEQKFSLTDQLDCMLLNLIDLFGNFTDFDWFSRPTDAEINWTLSVLIDCRFIETSPEGHHSLTPDGRIAVDLGRFHLGAQTSRGTTRMRRYAAVIAGFSAGNAGRIFRRTFSYPRLTGRKPNVVDPSSEDEYENEFGEEEEEEEIECPEEMGTLPATVCKLNVYYMWRRRKGRKKRKKFCNLARVKAIDFEEVHQVAEDMGEVEWEFDAQEWTWDKWEDYSRGIPRAEVGKVKLVKGNVGVDDDDYISCTSDEDKDVVLDGVIKPQRLSSGFHAENGMAS